MKFTNGYWRLREEMTPVYAAEYAGKRINGKELTVFAVGSHIKGRGDCLNIGMLTIRLTSPQKDIIKVSVNHFDRTDFTGPTIEINDCDPDVIIMEDERTLTYQSGDLKAVICKEPAKWEIKFFDEDRYLTDTGYRNMAHMNNRSTNENYMLEQLAIDIDEYVYGLGERFTPFIKNGQVVDMWNEDGGTSSEIAYKNIPFYITNKGYGILVDDEGDVSYEIASEKVERVQFSIKGEQLDYYVINGKSPKGTVQKYTELTGKPALPPEWSFGLWLTTSFTTNYDEETTSSFIDGMVQRDIPLHVFHFDCYWMEAYEWCNFEWDPAVFPDPAGMLKRYHDNGLHICVWINPYIGQKSPLFEEARALGYLLKKTDGRIFQTDLWQPGMALVDFTNPDAKAWFQSKLKKLLDMGVDCFKTDFGERIPVKNIAYFDHSDPVKMHNYYTQLYNRTVFKLLQQERGEHDAVLFARSATVGGQQFPAHWGGDCSASYSSMAETMRGGLSLACAGFGFWSHDISGFEMTATSDIYKRWCAFGLLSSHSRLHGSDSYRVPWLFDEESCDVLRKFVKLKCALMPYLYRKAVESHEDGIPMLRPMMLEFPEERACETLDKQYMLGDNLLVAPVFKESGEVEYYLPKGEWVNLLTQDIVRGGEWKKETYDYFSLPLLVRPNTILAIGANKEVPSYDYKEDVTFVLSQFTDGAKAVAEIPDATGEIVAKAEAVRLGDTITVVVNGTTSWKCTTISGNGVVTITDNQATIQL